MQTRPLTQPLLAKVFLLVLLARFFTPESGAATTYYISPGGNDVFPGTSPETAWKTPQRIHQVPLTPGDRVLFEGGESFPGPVTFDAETQGSEQSPVIVGSYRHEEAGPATILAGTGVGIDIYNSSNLRVENLKVVGDGAEVNQASGVSLLVTDPAGAQGIQLDHLVVSGFGKHGISIGAWETTTGYRDVKITHCITHDNLRTGIMSWGPWGPGIYAHQNVYIGYSEAFKMKGGSGITLSSVDGGVVERSLAHHNGEEFSGGAGIWAWDSNDILFQFNESYKNRTIGVDGDGFDFDGGVTNSVMQYNYSHDNDAAGFLLAQYPGAPQAMQNIVIRYNISENDCRRNGYGAIHVWNGEPAERIRNVHIYQNTTYLSTPLSEGQSAIAVITPTHSVAVWNNLFYTSDGNLLVNVVPGQENLRFQNNAYWSGGAPFQVKWYDASYTSLAAWLEAVPDQERLGESVLAVEADPMLEAPGKGGTFRRVDSFSLLTAYRLKPGSPLARRGINLLDTFGVQPGKHGFYGTPITQTAHPAIGAHATASL